MFKDNQIQLYSLLKIRLFLQLPSPFLPLAIETHPPTCNYYETCVVKTNCWMKVDDLKKGHELLIRAKCPLCVRNKFDSFGKVFVNILFFLSKINTFYIYIYLGNTIFF